MAGVIEDGGEGQGGGCGEQTRLETEALGGSEARPCIQEAGCVPGAVLGTGLLQQARQAWSWPPGAPSVKGRPSLEAGLGGHHGTRGLSGDAWSCRAGTVGLGFQGVGPGTGGQVLGANGGSTLTGSPTCVRRPMEPPRKRQGAGSARGA